MNLFIRDPGFSSHMIFCIGLFLYMSTMGVSGLRSVKIAVPEAVPTGEMAKLTCDYELENEQLYSIQWYFADEEFYRYVPKESPPTKVFPLHGMRVDVSQSNARTVTLQDVQRDISGSYRCEVSADAPLFHTEIKYGHMTVAELPEGDPTLFAEKQKYSLGEKIRANCTSRLSYPAANLTWFVNGQQIMSLEHTVVYPSVVYEVGDMEASQTRLELEATRELLKNGKLRLRCLATIFTLYRRSEEIELSEDTPHLQPVMDHTTPNGLGLDNILRPKTFRPSSGCSSKLEASVYMIAILSMALLLVLNTR